MLAKGFFYLALLIAKGFLAVEAHSPFSLQVEFGHASEARLIDHSNFDNEEVLPKSTYETYPAGLDIPSSFISGDFENTAVTIVQNRLDLNDGDVAYNSGYSSDTADHAYLRQSYNGVPFVNAVANLVMKDRKVFAFGSSFVNPRAFENNIAPPQAGIQVVTAIEAAEQAFPGAYNGHPTKLEYYAQPDGSVALVHVIQIQGDDIWFQVYVDAHSGQVVSSTNFRSDFQEPGYAAVPIEKQSIAEVPFETFIVSPADNISSPHGWHDNGLTVSRDTSGNNVIAFIDRPDQTTKESVQGTHQFKYFYDIKRSPQDGQNPDAARTNAFYTANVVHDIAYRYGFTEQAFNFQSNNFGKGGEGGDPVLVSVHNNKMRNGAGFHTPPDGQSGQCNVYLWDKMTPYRDGSLDNSVLVHELTHGITERMTGGGTAICLVSIESRGLGEGWSDAMAEWTEQTSAIVSDFTVGPWVKDIPEGLRSHPYSVNSTINPLKYSGLNIVALDVHAAGEIWANMLHNVYAALVNKYGFSSTARTNPDGREGNIVFLHLLMDGLSKQPCYPTFAAARDAIILSDALRYRGANKCLLWKVFASRGLGTDSKMKPYHQDGYEIPADCENRGSTRP